MKRLHLPIGLALAAAVVGAAPRASAQESHEFSLQYPAVITFENFAGVMYQRLKVGDGKTESVTAGSFTSYLPLSQPLPQLGFHYFVAPPLSIGAGLHYSDRDQLGSAFEISPRVGVAFPIDPGTAVWLRAGVTYFAYDVGPSGRYESYSGFMPGGEILFVLEPVDHFGFLVGAKFDVSAGAKRQAKGDGAPSDEEGFDYMQAGLTVGVLTDF